MTSDQLRPDREAKRQAHFAAAKKAVLGLAAAGGGECSMSDMHELSESKFFIAHQQFSAMLVECVAEGLVEVSDQTVVLTDKGHAFVRGA